MSKSLKIAVADDELDMRDFYRQMLTMLGHTVTAVVQTGRELVEFCRTQPPELILTDVMMPEMDGIDAVVEIWRREPLPAVAVSAHQDTETLRRLEESPIMAVLTKPVSRKDLGPVVNLAVLRFDQFRRLCEEATDVAQALRDRKVVERAKRLLFKDAGIDEADAFGQMLKTASMNNCKVADAARTLVAAADRKN